MNIDIMTVNLFMTLKDSLRMHALKNGKCLQEEQR